MNYFSDPTKVERLLAEVDGWAGTKFVSQTRGRPVKGVAADCVAFAEAVLVRVGAIGRIQWPAYVTHTGGTEMGELLFSTLDNIPRLEKLGEIPDPPDFMPGDLLACSGGDRGHHLAIFLGDNELIHCVLKGGVCHANIFDPIIRSNLKAVYRPQI